MWRRLAHCVVRSSQATPAAVDKSQGSSHENSDNPEFGERRGFYQTCLNRLQRGQANPTLNAMEVIANGLGLTVFEV